MASKNIKGITIEIGGDTTKLDKALRESEKSARSVQGELKEVEKALKLDPKNVTLLQQKTELLSKAISQAKDKVDLLKKSQSQIEQQFRNGKIGEEQYRAFQRELISAEAEVRRLEEAAKDETRANEKMSAAAEQGEKSFKMFTAGAAAAAAAVVAVGTKAVKAAEEMADNYDIVVKKTGASGEALEDLKGTVNDVFTDIPTTAEKAAIAVGEVNTRFAVTGEELEKLSVQFIEFAEINDTDLNNSIGITDKIMESWGISIENTGNLLGLITNKAQATGISVDTLMSAVQDNGAVFKESGLSIEESISLMAEFEAKGINASTAIAGLRKSVINSNKALAENSENEISIADGMKETIKQIKEAETETAALTIASELFGTKGAVEMTKAIREGRFSLDGLSASMADYGTTVEDTYQGTLTPIEQLQTTANEVKIAFVELGNAIIQEVIPEIQQLQPKVSDAIEKIKGKIPAIRSAISDVVRFVKEFVKFVIDHKTPILTILSAIAAAFVAWNVVSMITTLISVLQGLPVVLATINAVLAANPVGIIVTLIAALVAAFIYLWNNCDEFREFWINLWNRIKAAFVVFSETIKIGIGELKEVFNKLKDFLSDKINTIRNLFSNIIDFIRNVFTGNWSAAWENIKNIFKTVWDAFVDIARNPINTVLKLINNLISGFNTMIIGINSFKIDIPDWVPEFGGQSIGFNIPQIPSIPLLAKGGIVHSGNAIVGEAGPEMLTVAGGKTIVTPLTNNKTINSVKPNITINTTVNVEKIDSRYDVEQISRDLAVESVNQLNAVGGW